jgi:photosystem II stability/assembly factor-like uncharacterized protein
MKTPQPPHNRVASAGDGYYLALFVVVVAVLVGCLGLMALSALVENSTDSAGGITPAAWLILCLVTCVWAGTLVGRPHVYRAGLTLAMLAALAVFAVMVVGSGAAAPIALLLAALAIASCLTLGIRRAGRTWPWLALLLTGVTVIVAIADLTLIAVASPLRTSDLQAVTAAGDKRLLATGTDGTILASLDGGQHWNSRASATTRDLYGLSISASGFGIAVGQGDQLMLTRDDGVSWRSETPNPHLEGDLNAVAVESQRVVAVGLGILVSNDGGASWSQAHAPRPVGGYLAVAVQNQQGWAVGLQGLIAQTSDGGEHWTSQSSGTGQDLESVSAISGSAVWVAGWGGLVLHTLDGGLRWQLQQTGTRRSLAGIYFTDTRHGWAVGERGTILATRDGGTRWSPQQSGTKVDLNAVVFTDAEHGWAVGNTGTILRTVDGGSTWSVLETGTRWRL